MYLALSASTPPEILAEQIRICWRNSWGFTLLSNRDDRLPSSLTKTGEEFMRVGDSTNLQGDHTEAAAIMPTSGSTGGSKAVFLSREAIHHNAEAMGRLLGFSETTRHATCLPLHHCNAAFLSVIGCEIAGSECLIYRGPKNDYLKFLGEHGVETATIVPAFIPEVLNASHPWPETLREIITAAARLTREMAMRWVDMYGPTLRQGYGLTEATNFSFLMPRITDEQEWRLQYGRHNPPVGIPVGDTEARICKTTGEVFVRGTSVMMGVPPGDWLGTGDLGEFVNDPQFGPLLTLTGRRKEIINRGGSTISPHAIEEECDFLQRPPARGAVFPVRSQLYDDDIGVWIDRQHHEDVLPPPEEAVAVIRGPVPITATGKPMRMAMKARTPEIPHIDYRRVIASVVPQIRGPWWAKVVAGEIGSPKTPRGRYVLRELSKAVMVPVWDSVEPYEAVWRATEMILRLYPDRLEHAYAGDERPLWDALMHEEPMGAFGRMMADWVKAQGLSFVLEAGSGVGNTTKHLLDGSVRVTPTDARPGISRIPGMQHWNILQPWNGDQHEAVIATNVLHCVTDTGLAMRNMVGAVEPGGLVAIAEGVPTVNGHAWVMNALFPLEGWYDIGGFMPRDYWLGLMHECGLRDLSMAVVGSPFQPFGWLLWGRKR